MVIRIRLANFDANITEMGVLKKEVKLINHKIPQNIRIENSKQYSMKIEYIHENEWLETGSNVRVCNLKNQLN